ncbi:MAG: guanylate kinase [Azoarcus sp.]|jgi:guanylate kinase|nr:guanylate kinase [Azoarcus sp.]
MSGTLFTVSAPSGAGKTTLVHRLLERDPGLKLSVSYATRAPRQGEENGREYHFVSAKHFRELVEAGEFVEWAEVHGNCYGTSRTWLVEQLAQGRDTLLEIDWQGAAQVRAAFPEAISVFVLPPSLEALESRLRGRGTDSEAVIATRLRAARNEMQHVADFAYVIINEHLPSAVDDLAAIVRAARLRYASQHKRHPRHFEFLAQH